MDSKILNQKKESFGRLLEIMDRLRSECPWNKAQTIDTLRPLTIEEVYESVSYTHLTLPTTPYV